MSILYIQYSNKPVEIYMYIPNMHCCTIIWYFEVFFYFAQKHSKEKVCLLCLLLPTTNQPVKLRVANTYSCCLDTSLTPVLKTIFIIVSYHILVASLTLMALF